MPQKTFFHFLLGVFKLLWTIFALNDKWYRRVYELVMGRKGSKKKTMKRRLKKRFMLDNI